MLELATYDEVFLFRSREWLRDPETRALTRTPEFTDEQQLAFFNSLPDRHDYQIHGLLLEGKPVGAAGLKHITAETAEYWGYLGEKELWGKGLGGSLIQLMVNEGKRLGLTSLHLNVGKDNSRAIALYQKTGFVITENISDCLVMTKQL